MTASPTARQLIHAHMEDILTNPHHPTRNSFRLWLVAFAPDLQTQWPTWTSNQQLAFVIRQWVDYLCARFDCGVILARRATTEALGHLDTLKLTERLLEDAERIYLWRHVMTTPDCMNHIPPGPWVTHVAYITDSNGVVIGDAKQGDTRQVMAAAHSMLYALLALWENGDLWDDMSVAHYEALDAIREALGDKCPPDILTKLDAE